MPAEARDWQGTRRLYLRVADGRSAGTMRALHRHGDTMLDRAGVLAAWGTAAASSRTWLAAVRQCPPGARLVRGEAGIEPRFVQSPLPAPAALDALLTNLVADCGARAPMVALGGGLDAAIVLALWRLSGRALPDAITLQTDLPGYDESGLAERIARAFGVRLHRLRVSAEDLVAALPDAIDLVEQPLYNLHPVARLLLARAAQRLGAETLVTGDGADQACAAQPASDYLPLVAALTEGAGLSLWSPFFDEAVIAAVAHPAPDPQKLRLRALARRWGVPDWVVEARKVPQLAPALDLSRYRDGTALARLAAELGLPLELETDGQRVGWLTLDLARRSLDRERASSAA